MSIFLPRMRSTGAIRRIEYIDKISNRMSNLTNRTRRIRQLSTLGDTDERDEVVALELWRQKTPQADTLTAIKEAETAFLKKIN